MPHDLPDSVLACISTLMDAHHAEEGHVLRLAFASDESDWPLLSDVIPLWH